MTQILLDKESKTIKELLHTQDNRITDNPIFVVEKKVYDYGYEDGYEEGYTWVDFENGHYEADEEEARNLDQLWEKHPFDLPVGWRKVGYRIRWEFVTACLTEQGCKDYLKINGHNIGESRIYAHSGYRNYEWQHIRKVFME